MNTVRVLMNGKDTFDVIPDGRMRDAAFDIRQINIAASMADTIADRLEAKTGEKWRVKLNRFYSTSVN